MVVPSRNKVSAAEDRAEVERVLLGDISAFEGIVRRWQGPLINLAWRFCHDRGRAEEMAQEAFLRTYRSLQTWRGDAAFSTWLFALATNLYRTELRRIPQRTVPLDEVSEPMDLRVASSGIEEEQHNQIVHRAVSALPAKYRDAVVLFYFHEMDVSETARSLGIPEGTVKIRLFRAREILRNKLARVLVARQVKET
jgi:RNA polymerase sigma-70 factor (ECF subfamily)